MNGYITKHDGVLQLLLLVLSIVIPAWFFVIHGVSWWALGASIVYAKLIQRIGGGGTHLLVIHGLSPISSWNKVALPISWLLCGLTRASFFTKYHILHHAFVDTDKDPHCPTSFSAWYLILGLWALDAHKYDHLLDNDPALRHKFAKSLSVVNSLPVLKLTDKYYYAILFAIIACVGFFSMSALVYAVLIPIIFNIIDGNLFFVYLMHRNGVTRDMKWANWWFLNPGSGMHRIHHRGL